MGFTRLCRGDELVDTLHNYFGANVLAVPEERVQPLTAIARRNGKQVFRGALINLVSPGALDELAVQPSKMAELSGKQTRSVDVGLGLRILGGFLSGFGVPSAGVETHLKRTQAVSFRFGDVIRRWVDPGAMGRALDTESLDPNDSAARMYFGKNAWQLLVVDSVITSNRFSLAVSGGGAEDATIDVPAIQQLVGQVNANVSVSSTRENEVSFSGEQPLTFAFTLQRVYLDDTGGISMINPEDKLLGPKGAEGREPPAPVRLAREPALLAWDGLEDPAIGV
jgi:hypothetical protein